MGRYALALLCLAGVIGVYCIYALPEPLIIEREALKVHTTLKQRCEIMKTIQNNWTIKQLYNCGKFQIWVSRERYQVEVVQSVN